MASKVKKDLIIGDTSQVAQYFDQKIIRSSSRRIDDKIFLEKWNRVYLCFAEQRTSLSKVAEFKELFYSVNFDKTMMIINRIKAKKIIFLSTTELWNMCTGPIDLSIDFNFRQNYYTDSKLKITQKLKNRENVIIAYPFNFNSKFRSKFFLFGKVFDSITNKTKIELGNVDVSSQLKNILESKVIGSGRLTHVGDFINDLYAHANLNHKKYVTYNLTLKQNKINRKENWCSILDDDYSYNKLLLETIEEIL